MKKIISVALATLLVLSAVFTVPMVFADEVLSITNTYEEEGLGSISNSSGTSKLNGKYIFHLGEKSAAEREGRVLQFSAISGKTNIAKGNITYVEIYNPNDANFASFKPEVGKTYQITFDFKTQVWSNDIAFNIRGVKNTGIGDILVNAVTIAAKDPAYTGKYVWGTATTSVTITEDLKALAVSIEIDKAGDGNAYPYLDNIVLTEVKDEEPEVPECEHETTKDAIIEEATYFKAGLKNVVCADEACGAMVETDVVIPAAEAALNGDFTETFADGKLTISWTYSDALALDIIDGAKISFNYSINGYTKAVELSGETGETVILEGFNLDRLNAELTYNLSAVYGDVDTAKLNAVGGAVKTADIANDAELSALVNALNAENAETEVNGTVADTTWLVSNTAKLDIKAGTAQLKIAASELLVNYLKGIEKTGRVAKLTVKVGDITETFTIETLYTVTIINISGLSFEHLNGEMSAQLAIEYPDSTKNVTTHKIVFDCGDIIANADTDVANAFAAYMN